MEVLRHVSITLHLKVYGFAEYAVRVFLSWEGKDMLACRQYLAALYLLMARKVLKTLQSEVIQILETL